MGRRCAFSARKRSEARRPADVLPSVKPQRPERKVVRRRRRSKGMPRRGEFVGVWDGRGGRMISGVERVVDMVVDVVVVVRLEGGCVVEVKVENAQAEVLRRCVRGWCWYARGMRLEGELQSLVGLE